MRFYLADRILTIHYGHSVTGVKAISLSDETFSEHFPGYPVFPGSLILEGAAQLAGSFFELSIAKQNLPQKRCVLSIVNRFKFRHPAYPGDRLFFNIEAETMQETYGVVKVTVTRGNQICAEGKLTFVFVDIQNDTLHAARNALYEIWMRDAEEMNA